MFSLPPSIDGSMRAREWLQRGEFARLFDICVEEFVRYGYGPAAFEDHISGITHFLYWFKRRGGRIADLNANVVQQFLVQHLPSCHCAKQCARYRPRVRRALAALLRVLRGQRAKVDSRAIRGTVDAELADYERHLREVCGLTPQTRRGYLWVTKRFLLQLFGNKKFDSAMLTPGAIRDFIREMSSRRSGLSEVRKLRSYFRFKAVRGMQVAALLAAIPKTAQWSLARLPKTLTSAEIKRLLTSFDRMTGQGRRDYAMVRCLLDLGLRANETARLQLDDIDWRAGTVRIPSKGQRVEVLPLPRETGAALADYLRKSRPKTSSRALFMQLHAPVVAATAATVCGAVSRAGRRCGLQAKVKGEVAPEFRTGV